MTKFTDKQRAVIEHNQGNIVVSASAGSGKTSVMVERLIRLVSEGLADVKEILAVTFTRFAASEMREKLRKALVAKIKNGEGSDRLRQQLKDLPLASISTVDSFLNSLIKKYFYLVGVDSGFSVADEADSLSLKTSATAEVFDALYSSGDEDFLSLVKIFSKKRRDEALRKQVLELYTFLESETDGEKFLQSALYNYTEDGLKNIENGLIDRFICKLEIYLDTAGLLYERAINLKAIGYVTYLSGFINLCKNAIDNPCEASIKEIARYDLPKPRFISKGDELKEALHDDFFAFYDEVKDFRLSVDKYFYADFSERVNELKAPYLTLKRLAKLVGLFEKEYSRQKREQNLLDYSDISHLGYKLLQMPEVKEDIAKTYKFIFVDEYQDTNGIQESIFSLIENNNLFLVGDVKQSIYGFRGCFSGNFAKRIDDAEKNGTHIELDTNFRSAESVVDTVNKVFSVAMDRSTMGLEYKKHPMVYGGLYGDYEGETKLFYLPKKAEKEDALNLGVYSIYKHLLSERKEKVNFEKLVVYAVQQAHGKKIYDLGKKEVVEATYKDIAVLNRTVKSGVDKVVRELELAGIPTISENKRSIETYPEIHRMADILKCVLNPDDDIPLASSLKSPVGGLSDYELKVIRDAYKTSSFCEAVRKYAEEMHDEISEKLKVFYAYISRIRLLSSFEGAPTIIRRIIREKAINVELLSSCGGEYKMKRLEVFTQSAYKGEREMPVEEFLGGLDDFLQNATMPSGGGEDAVNVVSMHASKGLEYPIVIVAGVDRNWNAVDSKEEIACSRTGGVGLKIYDDATLKSKNSLVKNYVTLLKQEENLREELRLLYVALTRAKCCLYVVSKNEPKDEPLKDIFAAKRQLDIFDKSQISCEEVSFEDLALISEKTKRRALVLPKSDEAVTKEIKKYTDFVYPYKKDTMLSLKRTVTEIVREKAEKDAYSVECVKPIYISSDVDTGTAYHKFLQLADFQKIGDNGLIDGLFADYFTEEERKTIDINQIKKILNLNIFKEIEGYKIYKEHPFMVNIPPSQIGEDGDEDVLVQGVIDLIAVKDDDVIIIDYKYSGKNAENLKKTYFKQLDLYAYAAEKALNKKVSKKVLVNLKRNEEILL